MISTVFATLSKHPTNPGQVMSPLLADARVLRRGANTIIFIYGTICVEDDDVV
jgi:hypothetical protein